MTEGSASYEAVKLCYERGLMNGTSETAFNPQGKLTIAQLVVLAARLYDLQNGGSGTVPDLPDLNGSYLRFYDEEGNLIHSFPSWEELPSWNGAGENLYIALSLTPDDLELPETCKLEIGYQTYNHIRTFEGVKESLTYTTAPQEDGYMSQPDETTGYRFADPDASSLLLLPSVETVKQLKDAWWFPAVFYLCSESAMGFDGELAYRASGGNNDGGYDPLTRFSSDNASRALFAWLVDRTAGDLPVLNEAVNVPDVNPDETQDADAIFRLYQAGVLTGVDQAGNFNGGGELTRAQAAIMLARVLEPSLRVKTV